MWTTLEIGGDKKAENDQILRYDDHYWWKGCKDHVRLQKFMVWTIF